VAAQAVARLDHPARDLGGAKWFIPIPVTPLAAGADPAAVVAARVRRWA
jgi:hypothetical protein